MIELLHDLNDLMTRDYGNSGITLIMDNAGFIHQPYHEIRLLLEGGIALHSLRSLR